METLTLPKGGKTMEEGMVVEWLVEEGETVSAGDPVVTFESDKMTSDVVADSDGVLLERTIPEGETVPVGTVLGRIGSPDESTGDAGPTDSTGDAGPTDSTGDAGPTDSTGDAGPTDSTGDSATASSIDGRNVRSTPSARTAARNRGTSVEAVAAETGVDHVTAALVTEHVDGGFDVHATSDVGSEPGSGTDAHARPSVPEELTVEPVPNLDGSDVLASPWARVVASNAGVDVEDVAAAADTDRVREKHVDAYVSATLDRAPAEAAQSGSSGDESGSSGAELASEQGPAAVVREETLTGAAGVMFDRMTEVNEQYASTTTVSKVDVTALVELYERLSDAWSDDASLSLTAFVLRAVGRALPAYETLNAEVIGDREVRVYDDVNVGIAVNTESGLLVPTVYHADRRTLRELSAEIDRIATRAREGELDHDDLQNGTFTVSNAGNLGAYINTPQINPPQSAILGICTIVDEPGIVDGEVVPRKYMHLTLTYDHRVIEGADAVGFLQEVTSLLEHPESLLS